MAASPMLLRAAVILPLVGPPIRDGAILIFGGRIRKVGRWRGFSVGQRRAVDLGEVILMPGLVNAHCHLDYTQMAGQLVAPKLFTDWLKLITTIKAGWSMAEYEESWKSGARMLLRTGVTTVADIEAVPGLLPRVWQTTPLRVLSLMEMIGLTKRREPASILQETVERIGSLGASRFQAGLAPHAPYSTLPELLRLSARVARRRRWRLCTHVAESALEYEMFTHGRGEMFDWLERSTRDMSDCGLGSPVEHLERCRVLGPNLLAIHANYLGKRDAQLLGRRGVHVVHCPRSHAYFRHEPFPLRGLKAAGVNVCLGTDSLASVARHARQPLELSLFEEMRMLARHHSWLSPRSILAMATINGARALDLEGRVGQLTQNARADFIAIPLAGNQREVHEVVLHHKGNVAASMINGRWALPPPGVCVENPGLVSSVASAEQVV